DSVPARVALGEAILSQGRYADAVAEAALVEPGAPAAGAARRTEVFALLVSGELEAAARAIERGRSEMPAGEPELFGAWLGAARARAHGPRARRQGARAARRRPPLRARGARAGPWLCRCLAARDEPRARCVSARSLDQPARRTPRGCGGSFSDERPCPQVSV